MRRSRFTANSATAANWITVMTVATTVAIYVLSAAVALTGHGPGIYVTLLPFAPLGLMATSLPLVLSVIKIALPGKTALFLLLCAFAGGAAFQAAVLNGKYPMLIGALALLNLTIFVAAAGSQGALTKSGRRDRYESRAKLAAAIESVVKTRQDTTIQDKPRQFKTSHDKSINSGLVVGTGAT